MDELVEIFLKLSMKTVHVYLITRTTLGETFELVAICDPSCAPFSITPWVSFVLLLEVTKILKLDIWWVADCRTLIT